MRKVMSFLGLTALVAFWILGVNFREIRLGPAMMLQAFFLAYIGIFFIRGRGATVPVGIWVLLSVASYFLWRIEVSEGPLDLAMADQLLIGLGALGICAVGFLQRMGGKGIARWMLSGIGLMIVANLAAALWQWKGDPAFLIFEGRVKVDTQSSGLLTHHNPFAAMMVGFASYAMAGVLLARENKWRVIAALGVFACVGCVALSQSRGGSLGLGVSLVSAIFFAFLIRHFQKDHTTGRIALMGLGGVILILFLLGGYVAVIQEGRGKDLLGGGIRPALYQLATILFLEKPVDGHGPRAFSYLSAQRWTSTDNGWISAMPEFAHNEYLQILVDYGVLGLCLAFSFLAFVFVKGLVQVCACDLKRSNEADILLAGAFAGTAGFFVQSFFSFLIHIPSTMMLLVFHLGLLLSWNRCAESTVLQTIGMRLMGVIVMGGSLWLGLKGYQFTKVLWEIEVAEQGGRSARIVEAKYEAGDVTGQGHYYIEGSALALAKMNQEILAEDKEKWRLKAKKGYRRAFEVNPQAPEGASGVAIVLDMVGKNEEAHEWHQLAQKNAGGLALRLGFRQRMGLSLLQTSLKKMPTDSLAAEKNLREAEICLRQGRYVGETSEEYASRQGQRVFALHWIAYIEGKRLYIEGDRLWKKRKADRGMALMLAAERRYKSSRKQMIDFDPRWQSEWDQLQVNLKLLRGAKITPAKLTEEEIEAIAKGPFKDGLASPEPKR